MKKKNLKSLKLNKESISILNSKEVREVRGGSFIFICTIGSIIVGCGTNTDGGVSLDGPGICEPL